MKKIGLLAAACFAALSGAAFAADLPSRKAAPVYAPPPPPPPLWTGFYAGLNIGGGWSANTVNPQQPDALHRHGRRQSVHRCRARQRRQQCRRRRRRRSDRLQLPVRFDLRRRRRDRLPGHEHELWRQQRLRRSIPIRSSRAAFLFRWRPPATPASPSTGSAPSAAAPASCSRPTLLVYGTGGFAYGGVQGNCVGLQQHPHRLDRRRRRRVDVPAELVGEGRISLHRPQQRRHDRRVRLPVRLPSSPAVQHRPRGRELSLQLRRLRLRSSRNTDGSASLE